MSGPSSQLTIDLRINELCDFDNYYAAPNAEIVERLKELSVVAGFSGVWLWGETGTGRSHLLQAVCQAVAANDLTAMYLPLAVFDREPLALDGLSADLIAVDDVHEWLDDGRLEAGLMSLYEGQLSSGGRLLVSATNAAGGLKFVLADLASRMRALASYRIEALDDQGLAVVLRQTARRKGLVLETSVIDFWLARSVRRLPDLLGQLDHLDDAAMSAQRRITIPLLKEVLRL